MLWALAGFAPRRLSPEKAQKAADLKIKFGWIYAILGPIGVVLGIIHIVEQFRS